MENPIKMDDLGVPLFLETSIQVWDGLHVSFKISRTVACLLVSSRPVILISQLVGHNEVA